MLLDAGADISYRNPITEWTALKVAKYKKNTEVVKILSEKQDNINSELCAALDKNDIKQVRSALDNGAKTERKHINIA